MYGHTQLSSETHGLTIACRARLQACYLAAALVGGDEALCLMPQHNCCEQVRLRCQVSLRRRVKLGFGDGLRLGLVSA